MPLPTYRRRPLNQVGNDTRRKAAVRARTKAALVKRAKGHCEICTRPETDRNRLEQHHVFGRHQTGIPDEVLERPEACLAVGRLCCHDQLTNPKTQRWHKIVEDTRWAAYEALTGTPGDHREDPLGALRQWVRDTEAVA